MGKNESQIKETRAIRELRKQIIKLKKENAQLRKMNNRLANTQAEDCFDDNEEEYVPMQPASKTECTKCGSRNINILELRQLPYFFCQDCGGKGQIKK